MDNKQNIESITNPIPRTQDQEEEKKQFNPYANNQTAYPQIKDNPYTYNDDFGGEMDEGFERFDLKSKSLNQFILN
jgi:hypothetical protein